MRKSFLYLLGLFCMLVCYASSDAFAQKGKGKRPARKAKIQDTRIYLVHADVLHFDEKINPDATILNGKVHFTHQGARLYCDSAYFYEASNSFEAFGHVKMYQGDTLSLVSDYAPVCRSPATRERSSALIIETHSLIVISPRFYRFQAQENNRAPRRSGGRRRACPFPGTPRARRRKRAPPHGVPKHLHRRA